jgi:hypothetical protein
MTFSADKLAKMQNRIEFIIGYRNLVNILIIFFAASYLTLLGGATEGFVVGSFMFVIGITRFYDQIVANIDDLTIRDMTEKKDG